MVLDCLDTEVGQAILRGFLADPARGRFEMHDFILDGGGSVHQAGEIWPPPPRLWWDAGSGRGRGSGSGLGSGVGGGSGRGSGLGSGVGGGSGRGLGLGSGGGSGRGSGRGGGSELTSQVNQMEAGKAYLIHCGDWHTFVGRVVGQTGPHTYLLESCSKVSDTGAGDVWEQLAAGDEEARSTATYRHYKVLVTVVLTICAFEWVGKLPQEA